MKRRTVKVSRMIDQPQLLGKSPIRSCQNSSTDWQTSISGCSTFAMGDWRMG